MDFSTRPELAWLPLAMGLLLRVTPRNIVCPGAHPGAWGAKPARRRPAPLNRYPLGLHEHTIPEICLSLEGSPAIDTGEAVYDLPPERLAVLEPGVRHCEACARRDRGYAVMWFIASPGAVTGVVSRYRPGAGWAIAWRYSLSLPAAAALFAMFDPPARRLSAAQIEPLRANLLAIVGQLYQEAVHRAAPEADGRPAVTRHLPLLQQVREVLDRQLDRPVRVAQLAQLTRLTPNYLNSLFRAWTGKGVHQYRQAQRMDEAMRLCRGSDLLIKEIARQVGYPDALYFSRAFHRHHGRWPSEVRR